MKPLLLSPDKRSPSNGCILSSFRQAEKPQCPIIKRQENTSWIWQPIQTIYDPLDWINIPQWPKWVTYVPEFKASMSSSNYDICTFLVTFNGGPSNCSDRDTICTEYKQRPCIFTGDTCTELPKSHWKN